ncbi:MAG: 3-hydroxyisobutyrate dehydrogenase [Rhodospirillales bacterium 69-11]|nr:3-hydroxyisobutyrate dehydrogenase [Rhodospirillales bacterium]OJW25193.1 MAG: 3-hydroxyisobutyrate dehydrogenase [Rhodospirillales bacterium 69-11]
MAKIGFIGLGNMGGPMAANLVKAGHHVTGFDLVPASLDALKAAGGSVASSAAEAAKGAEVVITMLPAGEHVRQVWLHQGGLIDVVKDAGPLLIDCSTIDVASAREVAAAAETAGLSMLDAPVSGGTTGAQAGTLTFMVGGSEDAFARGQTVLQAMGKNIFHAGGPGAGQAVKICNNMMLAINMVGVAEGFLLAEKLGLDWQKLHAICSTATANSWALSNYCPAPGTVPTAPSSRDYAAGFMAALMLKDVKLSQAAADQTGSPTPLAAQAMSFYQAVVDAGEGTKDFSVVFRWLAGQARG